MTVSCSSSKRYNLQYITLPLIVKVMHSNFYWMDLDLILAITGKSLKASEPESARRYVQALNTALTHHQESIYYRHFASTSHYSYTSIKSIAQTFCSHNFVTQCMSRKVIILHFYHSLV